MKMQFLLNKHITLWTLLTLRKTAYAHNLTFDDWMPLIVHIAVLRENVSQIKEIIRVLEQYINFKTTPVIFFLGKSEKFF